MPDLGIFVLGTVVTAVVVIACRLVGRAEEEDARALERKDPGRP
jgi:hypothetical protein